MELKDQIIQEYLATGCGYRKLQKKYGFSRTTICKWVQVYQGIHNLFAIVGVQRHEVLGAPTTINTQINFYALTV